jgi:hypothetical protein
MRLVRATGAVADALRRYDPDIDVRYSWERRRWAIVFRTRRPDLIPKPVRWVETKIGPVETLAPENSEAYISYKTKTYPAGYVKRLGWTAYENIVRSDTQMRGGVASELKKLEDKREAEYAAAKKDRYKEARKFMNWHARTHIMAD